MFSSLPTLGKMLLQSLVGVEQILWYLSARWQHGKESMRGVEGIGHNAAGFADAALVVVDNKVRNTTPVKCDTVLFPN